MSYHIFPCAGRENYLTRRLHFPDGVLTPLESGVMMRNSGWNDPVLLSINSARTAREEPKWVSPDVNVLPTEVKPSATINKPFGDSMPKRTLPALLPRTPIQSMGTRSEHWYSDPIAGVFSNNVPQARGSHYQTINRSVFCQREGVQNGVVSPRVMERLANASNGLTTPSQHNFAKPHLSQGHVPASCRLPTQFRVRS